MSIVSDTITLKPAYTQSDWCDWRWQQRNAIRTVSQLQDLFPGLEASELNDIERAIQTVRMQLTPYVARLIGRTGQGSRPQLDDPVWRQLVPRDEIYSDRPYDYDGSSENWELPEEMVSPIAQHKYPNRIIIRLSNVCLSYCQFCYEALRTLERESEKGQFRKAFWLQTLDYVRDHEEVEELILSGGEPLMLSDENLDEILGQIAALNRKILVRVHTRALAFNPFRVTDQLAEIFHRHQVASVGLHICHPNELTPEFKQAVVRLQSASPILFANIPLLRGINDSVEIMRQLCMELYGIGVIPHYLYHFMPHSPASEEFRTSVRSGVEIVRTLKRKITNLAVPEFVLPHYSGKYSMPLLADGEEPPRFWIDDEGRSFVRFTNWKREQVDYFDGVCEV